MIGVYSRRFEEIVDKLTIYLFNSPVVKVGEWQAIQADIPQSDTIELEDVSVEVDVESNDWNVAVAMFKPNIPWAEDHFQERVSGIPHNPPPSHEWWPYAQKSNDEHIEGGRFSHTYPERFWPKFATDYGVGSNHGIRYGYGDLADVVQLLKDRPGTRQAFLPVWFPEDTGAVENQRVPCTLGYHFLIREGKLKIVYYIRSCDFFRHFRDDIYLAARLGQWVAEQLEGITFGRVVMHISSLHIFAAERPVIDQMAEAVKEREMSSTSW